MEQELAFLLTEQLYLQIFNMAYHLIAKPEEREMSHSIYLLDILLFDIV